eukprot:TRINITY_DN20011_c0_g1_i1.p1 TRINITY_DN20011_c0_g1~~TRINITY_DN20011_c0_g1_i1.p1  ORF type:complete len:364 (-),score=57.34 TRINITY_DN20011_c0_g1_i1:134-1225(-)
MTPNKSEEFLKAHHLIEAAKLIAPSFPALSRSYVTKALYLCLQHNINLSPAMRSQICQHCGTIFIAGLNCKVSVKRKKQLSSLKRKRMLQFYFQNPIAKMIYKHKDRSFKSIAHKNARPKRRIVTKTFLVAKCNFCRNEMVVTGIQLDKGESLSVPTRRLDPSTKLPTTFRPSISPATQSNAVQNPNKTPAQTLPSPTVSKDLNHIRKLEQGPYHQPRSHPFPTDPNAQPPAILGKQQTQMQSYHRQPSYPNSNFMQTQNQFGSQPPRPAPHNTITNKQPYGMASIAQPAPKPSPGNSYASTQNQPWAAKPPHTQTNPYRGMDKRPDQGNNSRGPQYNRNQQQPRLSSGASSLYAFLQEIRDN